MKKILSLGVVLLIVLGSCQQKTQQKEVVVTDEEIIDSYVYLLSRALVVRQEQMDFEGTGLEYNTIKYNEAGKADFVNPNLDVAYMEAWIAVDENTAVILEVPEIKDRYFTVQLLDGWGEVVANINDRNFPAHPYGTFAIKLKGSQVELPEGAYPIDIQNRKVKMLARVELQDDLEGAVALQKQFKVTAVGVPEISPIIGFPKFTNKQLPEHRLFDFAEEFLRTPDTQMPNADSLQAKVNSVSDFVGRSDENAAYADSIIKTRAWPEFIQFATTKAGAFENGWLATLKAGNYYGDYWTRTSANFVGIWANTSKEVVYFIAAKGADDQPLGGGKRYRLTFTPDNLPENHVNGFWSVILVDFPGYRVVENELGRYNFNDYSAFEYGKDGSLTLYISPEYDSDWPKSNWLPSPEKAAFNLTLRMYVPHEEVLNGKWFPAGLEVIE
ncbi:DUF1214 domain-containing protein [Echinicola rosea]|uniref:DUF1254 domain-containing protein n=1 Tax=Echinicola rosea TaxID=1807691 RepID=A0ABQ1VA06_9BACT|nr:DUF1214 domain-containing protein [Echinicola rosea]GGF47805.1 hypothetical protein GCM10011339_40470 [Echinicola rosea]